jgi:hypothetical protein
MYPTACFASSAAGLQSPIIKLKKEDTGKCDVNMDEMQHRKTQFDISIRPACMG